MHTRPISLLRSTRMLTWVIALAVGLAVATSIPTQSGPVAAHEDGSVSESPPLQIWPFACTEADPPDSLLPLEDLEIRAMDGDCEEVPPNRVDWTTSADKKELRIQRPRSTREASGKKTVVVALVPGTYTIMATLKRDLATTAAATITVSPLASRLLTVEPPRFSLDSIGRVSTVGEEGDRSYTLTYSVKEAAHPEVDFWVGSPASPKYVAGILTDADVETIGGTLPDGLAASYYLAATDVKWSKEAGTLSFSTDLALPTPTLGDVYKRGGRAGGKLKLFDKCENIKNRSIRCRRAPDLPEASAPSGPQPRALLPFPGTCFPDDTCLVEISGRLEVDVTADLDLDVFEPYFELWVDAKAAAEVVAKIGLNADWEQSGEKERRLFSRRFVAMGIPGKITLFAVPGYRLEADVDGFTSTITATGNASMNVGVCSSGCTTENELGSKFEVVSEFCSDSEKCRGDIELTGRVYVLARLRIEWANAKAQADIGPFVEAVAEGTDEGHGNLVNRGEHEESNFEPFPIVLPRLHAGLDTGVQWSAGAEVNLLFGTLSTPDAGGDFAVISLLDWWAEASELAVDVTMKGQDLDPNGFDVSVRRDTSQDIPDVGDRVRVETLGPPDDPAAPTFEATAIFSEHDGPCLVVLDSPSGCDLIGTRHTLGVGLEFNCSLTQADEPHLHPFAKIRVAVEVVCQSVAEIIQERLEGFPGISPAALRNLTHRLARIDATRATRPRAATHMVNAAINYAEALPPRHLPPDAQRFVIESLKCLRDVYIQTPTTVSESSSCNALARSRPGP